jgi:hypothetical protein
MELNCVCGRSIHFLPGFLQRHSRIPSSTPVCDLRFRLKCGLCNLRDRNEPIEVYERPDSLQPPDDSGGNSECCREGFGVSVEAGRDAAPILEAAEHALDDVAFSVESFVTWYWILPFLRGGKPCRQ